MMPAAVDCRGRGGASDRVDAHRRETGYVRLAFSTPRLNHSL